jgi:hypothetical protein
MRATELLEQFRQMSLEEQVEVLQRIQIEFADELPPDMIAQFEARAERLRRNPALGVTWGKVRAELAGRLAQGRACPAK